VRWTHESIQDIENFIKQRDVVLSIDDREADLNLKVKDMKNKLEDHEKE